MALENVRAEYIDAYLTNTPPDVKALATRHNLDVSYLRVIIKNEGWEELRRKKYEQAQEVLVRNTIEQFESPSNTLQRALKVLEDRLESHTQFKQIIQRLLETIERVYQETETYPVNIALEVAKLLQKDQTDALKQVLQLHKDALDRQNTAVEAHPQTPIFDMTHFQDGSRFAGIVNVIEATEDEPDPNREALLNVLEEK